MVHHRSLVIAASSIALAVAFPVAAAPVHTTYLWHMHQPIYWPTRSTTNGKAYEFAHETIVRGHSQSDVASIFNVDDRVHDYQDYPKAALQSVLAQPDAGAQVSFAGSLIQNVESLAAAGWNGGRYAANWTQPYRDAQAWTTSGGRRRLEPVVVAFHHSINPLLDAAVFRRQIQAQKAIMPGTWGRADLSAGFFPAEMCFSERLIPVLASEGIAWSIVPDVHLARACADYPYAANQDNCDPPNRADQLNPAQGAGAYTTQSISRGVVTKVPAPFGFRPHRAQYVDPATGAVSSLTVVPSAMGMSWNEGYGLYGTGEIDAIAPANDPAKPMLIVFSHDGDNAWSGGYSYYNENVRQFVQAAAGRGYEPTTIAEYLADHPVDPADVVKVEDGGWVNADGDFGSPQFINWNWPLTNAAGQFDIPGGWAEDERNWAVLTAATNRVLTAEQLAGGAGAVNVARIVDPTAAGATDVEKAWHFLLAGHESGFMYYGSALDFEVKPTLAANHASEHADAVSAPALAANPAADVTPPTVWLPQRLPWNPGGAGGGALWGYPGGSGAAMSRDFHVWTFAHDVSGIASATLKLRFDTDGTNPLASTQNETYAGGPEVSPWQSMSMTKRAFPKGNVFNRPDITFSELPTHMADQYTAFVTGLQDTLVDYYVEVVDSLGNVQKSPIQHVWVGAGNGGGGGGGTGGGAAVTWTPAAPVAGGTLTITYDTVPGALPDATNPVKIHVGHSGWLGALAPDPAMTFDADSSRWTYTYAIPATATAVDFVFTNGGSAWDNNGGADWHVPVTGASPPPHVADGTLDPGLTPRATCAGRELHVDYDGRWLYVAAPATGTTSGLDHFLFVARPQTTGTRAAPWAKSGTAPQYDLLLGNEDGNNWAGWFDAAGTPTTNGKTAAAGTWLEGVVDVQALWNPAPSSVLVGFAAYGTADGGALGAQAPCGDGDPTIEPGEWIEVASSLVGVDDSGDPAGDPDRPALGPIVRLLSAQPARDGRFAARVTWPAAATRGRVDLVDVRGRVIAMLFDGAVAGGAACDVRGPGGQAPGVYFVRAMSAGAAAPASARIVVMR